MMAYNFIQLLIVEYFLFILSESKVIFVFEHYRHGARSPSDLFENDLDLLKEKWNGNQELTNLGIRQEYLLGNFIRNKYPDLINYEKYNPKEIGVFSTMTNRTIMSARAHINGIFNIAKKQKLNEKQKNTSIPYYLLNEIDHYNLINISLYPDYFAEEVPVHVIDFKEKLIQLEKNDYCPDIKKLRNKNKERKEIKDFIQKFNDTFGKQLLDIYDIKDNKDFYMDYENVNDICIGIIINKFDDRKLNLFQNKIDLEALHQTSQEFFKLKTTLVYANDEEGNLGYIGASIFMRKILSYMERIINDIKNNVNNSPKLVLFASHDTAISNMEGILDSLFNIQPLAPTYASSYIFELVEERDNEYFVNFIFNNKTLKKVEYIDFKKKIENDAWTYEQTGKYCGFIKEDSDPIITPNDNINDDNNGEKSTWKIIIIVFSIINIVTIGVIIYLILKLKNKDLLKSIFKI